MSVRITLHCNTVSGYSSCAHSLMTDGLTIGEARTIGAAYGWRHHNGKDYCPGDSRTYVRPRVILPHLDESLRVPELSPDELLQNAEDMLLALVNRATGGPWRYRPDKAWMARYPGEAEEHVAAGPADDPVCIASTGPADDRQSMADAAYIATVDPDVGRAVTAVLHEAFETVHQDGGIVDSSLSQAAVDLAAAIHRTPAGGQR